MKAESWLFAPSYSSEKLISKSREERNKKELEINALKLKMCARELIDS